MAHQFQQQPRARRLDTALKAKQMLDLDDKDVDTIGDFMDAPLDPQVHTRVPFSQPSLLPRFACMLMKRQFDCWHSLWKVRPDAASSRHPWISTGCSDRS